MADSNEKNLQDKAEKAKVSEVQVETFMTRNVVTLLQGTRIYSAIKTLENKKIGAAPIVDSSGRILGIISGYDLLMQAATRDVAEPVHFTKDVAAIGPETQLKDILALFYTKKYKVVPVVDRNNLVIGIVSRIDVLSRLVQSH